MTPHSDLTWGGEINSYATSRSTDDGGIGADQHVVLQARRDDLHSMAEEAVGADLDVVADNDIAQPIQHGA